LQSPGQGNEKKSHFTQRCNIEARIYTGGANGGKPSPIKTLREKPRKKEWPALGATAGPGKHSKKGT